MAAFFIDLFDDDIVGAFVAAVVDVLVPDAAFSELTESSLCHLELLCRAVFIWAQSSFLHDFDLEKLEINVSDGRLKDLVDFAYRLIDWSQSLN